MTVVHKIIEIDQTRILTTKQQMITIKSEWTRPAVPTIQARRMKKRTPKMFCTQGKKTPMNVPMVALLVAAAFSATPVPGCNGE